MNGRVLSLSPLTVLDASPAEQVTAAASAGFDAVGIRVLPAADERIHPMLGETAMLRETLARLVDTGLTVLDVELISLRPEHRPQDALAVLDAGHRLGARFALVLGYDSDESRLVDRFGWLCEQAQQRGIRPGLEFMKYSPVQTLQAAVRIVQRAGHPAGCVLVDALHLQRSGGTPTELATIPAELLPYGQLCDGPLDPIRPDDDTARAESRTDRRFPGDGQFPLTDLIHALPPGGALSVEAPVAACAQQSPAERATLAHAAAVRVLTADAAVAAPPTPSAMVSVGQARSVPTGSATSAGGLRTSSVTASIPISDSTVTARKAIVSPKSGVDDRVQLAEIGGVEQRAAEQEHPPAAQQVGQPAAEHQQAGQRQHAGVQHPLLDERLSLAAGSCWLGHGQAFRRSGEARLRRGRTVSGDPLQPSTP